MIIHFKPKDNRNHLDLKGENIILGGVEFEYLTSLPALKVYSTGKYRIGVRDTGEVNIASRIGNPPEWLEAEMFKQGFSRVDRRAA